MLRVSVALVKEVPDKFSKTGSAILNVKRDGAISVIEWPRDFARSYPNGLLPVAIKTESAMNYSSLLIDKAIFPF